MSDQPNAIDHLGRDAKDFAIEFGEYLAQSAELLLTAVDVDDLNVDGETFRDHYQALENAIYEFRKRAFYSGGARLQLTTGRSGCAMADDSQRTEDDEREARIRRDVDGMLEWAGDVMDDAVFLLRRIDQLRTDLRIANSYYAAANIE